MLGTIPRNPSWCNLSSFAYELPGASHILVVWFQVFISAKTAYLFLLKDTFASRVWLALGSIYFSPSVIHSHLLISFFLLFLFSFFFFFLLWFTFFFLFFFFFNTLCCRFFYFLKTNDLLIQPQDPLTLFGSRGG